MSSIEQKKLDGFKKFTNAEKVNTLLDTYNKHIELNPDDLAVKKYITTLTERKSEILHEKKKVISRSKNEIQKQKNSIKDNSLLSKYQPKSGANYYDFFTHREKIQEIRKDPSIVEKIKGQEKPIEFLKEKIVQTIKDAKNDWHEEVHPNIIGGGYNPGNEQLNPASYYNDKISFYSTLILEISKGQESGLSEEKFNIIKKKREQKLSNLTQGKSPIKYLQNEAAKQGLKNEIHLKTLEKIQSSVVAINSFKGHGTGFFIAENMIITNQHVIANDLYTFSGESLLIKSPEGKNFTVNKIIKHPTNKDMAILITNEKNPTFFTPSQKELKKGDIIYHAGYGEEYIAFEGNKTPAITLGSGEYEGRKNLKSFTSKKGEKVNHIVYSRRKGTELTSNGDSGGILFDEYGNYLGVHSRGISGGIDFLGQQVAKWDNSKIAGFGHSLSDILKYKNSI